MPLLTFPLQQALLAYAVLSSGRGLGWVGGGVGCEEEAARGEAVGVRGYAATATATSTPTSTARATSTATSTATSKATATSVATATATSTSTALRFWRLSLGVL